MPRHNFWGERRIGTRAPAAAIDLAIVTGRDSGNGRAVLAVFYKGDAAACRPGVERFQEASRGRSRLTGWCDMACAPWALGRWGIDGPVALRRIHVVDATGAVYGGAEAFARLWRELPGYRWLGRVVGLPGIGFIAELFYRRLAGRTLACTGLHTLRHV